MSEIFETDMYGIDPEDGYNHYAFYCNWNKTRNGFSHTCELHVNGRFELSVKCNYYNRTWEAYDYQTVMYKAINSLIEERMEELEKQFKSANGYVNMTQKRRIEFDKFANSDGKIIELQRVSGKIKNGFKDY